MEDLMLEELAESLVVGHEEHLTAQIAFATEALEDWKRGGREMRKQEFLRFTKETLERFRAAVGQANSI